VLTADDLLPEEDPLVIGQHTSQRCIFSVTFFHLQSARLATNTLVSKGQSSLSRLKAPAVCWPTQHSSARRPRSGRAEWLPRTAPRCRLRQDVHFLANLTNWLAQEVPGCYGTRHPCIPVNLMLSWPCLQAPPVRSQLDLKQMIRNVSDPSMLHAPVTESSLCIGAVPCTMMSVCPQGVATASWRVS
jgi:hypothetical protein